MLMSLPVKADRHTPVTDLVVYLTEECNLRCSYCFVDKKPRHMSAETAQKVMDFFLRSDISGSAPSIKMNFFGGEPFLKVERMEELWKSWQRQRGQHDKELSFSATTNGTIAGPRVERMVRDAQMPLLVSLDGDAAASAARPFVSGRASHDVVCKNLPKLIEWSPSVTVRLTFHPDSLELVKSIRFALELGAPWIVMAPVVEADWRGKEELVEERFQELADWFIGETRQGKPPPLSLTWSSLRDWHLSQGQDLRPKRPCPVGDSLLGVDPDGNVMPCHRFLYRKKHWLGHVEGQSLAHPRDEYVQLHSSKVVGCDGCIARPICGGGCRVVALQSGAGLYGTQPFHCLITRAHARAVQKIYEALRALPSFQSLYSRAGPEVSAALMEANY